MARQCKTWDYITMEAINTDGMSNKDRISFHYFNPNGLYAHYRVMWVELYRAVELKQLKSGALLAYDCDYHYNEMLRLHNKKRVSTIEIDVFIKLYWEAIERGYKRLCKI